MRCLLFSALIVGASWVCLTSAMATPLGDPGLSGTQVTATPVENVGYWRRQYRRYGYPVPYAYYPPAYGYYPPPVVYAYPPAVYGYQPSPPAANPSAEEDYGSYPPAEGDYPAAGGEYGEYPANGS